MRTMHRMQTAKFLSTPSARRATEWAKNLGIYKEISIHALREEGDPARDDADATAAIFLSTPSARRATDGLRHALPGRSISIHALREEGDSAAKSDAFDIEISIHALREEGDGNPDANYPALPDFYPRPPRGGRLRRRRDCLQQ